LKPYLQSKFVVNGFDPELPYWETNDEATLSVIFEQEIPEGAEVEEN
jgi:hypothetical protein